jgi:hypothetical protein
VRFGFVRDNNQLNTPVIGSNILEALGVPGVPAIGLPTHPVLNVTGITSPIRFHIPAA